MQFNTFVASTADLDRCARVPRLSEVLLEPALLARQGQLSESQTQQLAQEARQRGLRPVLVWDALMPERAMVLVSDRLQQWDLSLFGAIRVSDPGAACWIKLHHPEMPIQLIVETGNHNLESLLGWCELLEGSLERLVLSIELPEEKLMEYCQKLPVACELLGVGQILLFYSPRSLLSGPLGTPEELESAPLYLEAIAAFEESPNRPFPTVETAHGTLMFLDKDQFILDQLQGLESAGLHTVRLDLRHLSQPGDAATNIEQVCQQMSNDPVALRKSWARETRAPFFKANRTTSLFARLKTPRSNYPDAVCLAEAIAGEGGKYIVFHALRQFEASQVKRILLPTGFVMSPPPITFRDVNGLPIDTFEPDQLIVTDWIKKTVTGSLLLSQEEPDHA